MASVREVLGAGVSAQYRGKPLLVGSDSFVRRQAKLPAHLADCYRHPPAGASTLLIAWDGQVRTILWLGDRLRSDAAVSLSQLRARGHRLHLLSGDQPRRVLEVADELRRLCEDPDLFQSVRGGVSPEEKLAAVASLAGAQSAADHRPVVMIGDGINDAGALARADVGIAVQGAAEASRLSADVYLARPGVSEILSLIEGSQRTLSIITRGLVFSLFYNALGIVGAASGLLGPLGAAVLMPLSSLTVVTNAYRSRSFGSVKDEETLLAVPESAGK
jgi:P-type E1-E2 ATPase